MANVVFETRKEAEAFALTQEQLHKVVKLAAKQYAVEVLAVDEDKPVAEAAPAARGTTKVAKVHNMLQSGGASVPFIAAELEISKIAAQSLIGDLKRKGIVVLRRVLDDKTGIYYCPSVVEDEGTVNADA
jgi:exosome complex RNA-binding protein Csl4